MGRTDDFIEKIAQLTAERDAAANAADTMRETLCIILALAQNGRKRSAFEDIEKSAKHALDQTGLHSFQGGMWQGHAVECKGWERRALAAEARLAGKEAANAGESSQ